MLLMLELLLHQGNGAGDTQHEPHICPSYYRTQSPKLRHERSLHGPQCYLDHQSALRNRPRDLKKNLISVNISKID